MKIYNNGPWSYCKEDVISDLTSVGSKLLQWMPTSGVNTRNETVPHLSWIAPANFTGAQSYADYLAALPPIGQCDYGPSATWNACEYTVPMYFMSFKSPQVQRSDYALLECERAPIYRLRGPNAGMPIDNDADWALGLAARQLQEHLEFVKFYGDPDLGQLMYQGLDVVISTGWVANNKIGPGSCNFTDPKVINGTGLTTPAAALQAIKFLVRNARKIASQRRVTISPQDMVVVMSSTHWAHIADAIAAGGLVGQTLTNVNLQMDVRAYFDERARITQATDQFDGFIEVDSIPVYVITDDLLASTVTLPNNKPGVRGDIFVLTRAFGGVIILEHQYLDWRQSRMRNTSPIEEVILQNGMVRSGFVETNNKCFYYWVEMGGRIVSRMQPLQGKITDVVFETYTADEHFAGSFASPNFYAFDGQLGGQGVNIIQGL